MFKLKFDKGDKINMAKKEVRDGFLGDLPEEIRDIVMNIHKMIVDGVRNEFKMKKYDYLWDQQWAKTMLDEFLVMPTDKNEVGSVRVFRKGKRYSCMIQMTAHVTNNRNTEDEEFFHGMLRNAHTSLRAKVRKKYDLKLECESVHGEPFEGFDLWISGKEAKKLWEAFDDKKTKEIKESFDLDKETMIVEMCDLPHQLQYFITSTNKDICTTLSSNKEIAESFNNMNGIGSTIINRIGDSYSGRIEVAFNDELNESCNEEEFNELMESVLNDVGNKYFESDNTKDLVMYGSYPSVYFEYALNPSYAKVLYEWLTINAIEESKSFGINIDGTDFKVVQDNEVYTVYNSDNSFRGNYDSSYRQDIENELKDDNKSYTEAVNASEVSKAKTLFRGLSKSIMEKGIKITQPVANTYANVVTNELLRLYTTGYQKFNLKIDNKLPKNVVRFKIDKIEKDFVSRFIYGRETLNGFLHRNPEITLCVNSLLLYSVKNQDDLFYFFINALRFYETGTKQYSDKIMNECIKMDNNMKQLVSTTKLSSIVSLPLQMIFSFEDIDMSNHTLFKVEKDDIDTVCKFIKTISTNYASPKNQKDEIINDLKKIVEAYDYHIGIDNEDQYVVENVIDFYDGKYNDKLESYHEAWINSNINTDWERLQKNPEIKLLQEKFGVKKLKKIPKDTVAYITIEAECIRDGNDKLMLASYCTGKIEIVEWYLELLEVGSKKYIVPHTKQELQTLHTQLLACYKKIMDTPIPKQDRPIIDIKYPAGYEG